MTLDGILARLQAIWHKVCHPSHKILWNFDPVIDDPEFNHNGDIVCAKCDKVFWCRWYDTPVKNRENL